VLGPLVAAAHPSGVGCIAATPGVSLRFFRADTPEGPIDRLEVHSPETSGDMPVYAGATLYAGPYFAHFGHAAAESIHRLWATHHFADLREARIVFQADAGAMRPAWFDAVLEMVGIAPERVLLLDHVARFDELHIPAQGRALGGALLLPDYLSLFPLAPVAVPTDAPKRLYVSRSRHRHSGVYLGESLVERVLEQAGFMIIHPQDLAVRSFAGLLRGAETIIFAEGSAIHNLELTGPVDARVMVVGRRDGVRRKFKALVESLSPETAIFASARVAGSLGWDRLHDRPHLGVACSTLPIGALIAAIADFAGVDLPQPDAGTIRDAMRADLLLYLLDPRSGQNASEAELGRALRALREDPEIRALL
jgi:hypothetical protein